MSYQVHHYKKGKSSEVKIVESILKAIWTVVSWPFRIIFKTRPSSLKCEKYRIVEIDFVKSKWQEIEQLIMLGKPSNYARAVLEADKLIDHVLKGFRAPGTTMGDRLKASKNRFSYETYDGLWKAHKIRNELVHNSEFQLMDYQARDTISKYKKALNELVQL